MTPATEFARFATVPIDIEVVLDRRILTVRQILELRAGSLIGTGRSAGDNIDVYIGGALVCSAEIVVIENTMGVRVTDFVSED